MSAATKPSSIRSTSGTGSCPAVVQDGGKPEGLQVVLSAGARRHRVERRRAGRSYAGRVAELDGDS